MLAVREVALLAPNRACPLAWADTAWDTRPVEAVASPVVEQAHAPKAGVVDEARTIARCVAGLNLGIAGVDVVRVVVAGKRDRRVGFRSRPASRAGWARILLHCAVGLVRVLLPQTGGGVVLYLRMAAFGSPILAALGWWSRRRPGTAGGVAVAVDAVSAAVDPAIALACIIGLWRARRSWVWLAPPGSAKQPPA